MAALRTAKVSGLTVEASTTHRQAAASLQASVLSQRRAYGENRPLANLGLLRLWQTCGSGNDGSMTKEHYPDAIPAAEIVDEIGKRRVADPAFRYGYECLFIAETSTRPSMEFSLLPAGLNSPDWRSYVVQQVERAMKDARVGETVYFDAD